MNLIYCDVKPVCYCCRLLLFSPLYNFTGSLHIFFFTFWWRLSLYNLLNMWGEIIAVETLVLAVSRSSLSQFQLRRKFCGRKGEKKIKLWYSDYGGVDKALNGAKEVWMDAVACELKQSNYCFIIVFFSFFWANRAAEPHSERLWHLGGQALYWTLQV